MDLDIAFLHTDSSPALAAYAERRAQRLAPLIDDVHRLRVACRRDAGWADVEIVARAGHRQLVARAESADMYEALDAAFDRLARRATREHERRVRRRGRPSSTAPSAHART